jgi:arsenate reductase
VTTLYGIKNCDSVKKARRWLEAKPVAYTFHDVRIDGITADQIKHWIETLGWEAVVNKRSTSWKQLDQTVRENMDEKTAVDEILLNPTLIKRPVLENEGNLVIGFKDSIYAELF